MPVVLLLVHRCGETNVFFFFACWCFRAKIMYCVNWCGHYFDPCAAHSDVGVMSVGLVTCLERKYEHDNSLMMRIVMTNSPLVATIYLYSSFRKTIELFLRSDRNLFFFSWEREMVCHAWAVRDDHFHHHSLIMILIFASFFFSFVKRGPSGGRPRMLHYNLLLPHSHSLPPSPEDPPPPPEKKERKKKLNTFCLHAREQFCPETKR